MPTVNHFFNNFGNSSEQLLIENLVTESIKIYGIEVYYMPRTLVNHDMLFDEATLSKFEYAIPIEMYIKSVDGFEGDGDFLSKFGLEIRDTVTLTVSRRRFGEELDIGETTPVEKEVGIARPSEGDLIFLPLNNKLFEVKFVEHESVFYQLGSLQTYDLRCELFEYSQERFDTGINVIDSIEEKYSADITFYQLLMEDGSNIAFEDGTTVINDGFRIEDVDPLANNEYYTIQSNSLDFIDWTESNPFGEI